jgi:hypothetical protein
LVIGARNSALGAGQRWLRRAKAKEEVAAKSFHVSN